MATFSGLFQFDDGSSFFGTTGSFTENGVTFTLSSSGTPTGFAYFPNNVSQTGAFGGSDTAAPFDASLTLAIDNTNGFSKFTGTFTVTAAVATGSWQLFHNMNLIGTFTGSGQTLKVTSGQSGGSQIKFANSSGSNGFLLIDSMNTTISCFCTHTRIATPDGWASVETLRHGMRLLSAGGGETTVKWLGEQPVDTRLNHPAKVNPICITAGALDNCLPERDLHLSADHAICIGGMLINAGALVNGETIYQVKDMPLEGFTYYHVETEGGHELILAEGVAAESFIDYADTDSFQNADERTTTAPIPEMNLPRISAARLVPQAVRDRLAERAVALRTDRGFAIAAE